MTTRPQRLIIALFGVGIITAMTLTPPVSADAGLTQEDKQEKRLLFNEYIDKEMTKQRLATDDFVEEGPWSLDASVLYGYDNNVTLDSKRDSDLYHTETFEAAYTLGPWQFSGYTDYTGYQDREEFDNHMMTWTTSYQVPLADSLLFEIDYDLNILRYPRDNALDYKSHAFTPSLTLESPEGVTHQAFVTWEYKKYRDRQALSMSNTELTDLRSDRFGEIGYSLNASLNENVSFGTNAAWKINDSNDQHKDFNDYEGYRFGGYLFHTISKSLSWLTMAGYDFREYDDRTFVEGSSKPERDNYFYLGANLYYALSESVDLTFGYFYNQNDSNDPDQEYSGATFSGGLQFRI